MQQLERVTYICISQPRLRAAETITRPHTAPPLRKEVKPTLAILMLDCRLEEIYKQIRLTAVPSTVPIDKHVRTEQGDDPSTTKMPGGRDPSSPLLVFCYCCSFSVEGRSV